MAVNPAVLAPGEPVFPIVPGIPPVTLRAVRARALPANPCTGSVVVDGGEFVV